MQQTQTNLGTIKIVRKIWLGEQQHLVIIPNVCVLFGLVFFRAFMHAAFQFQDEATAQITWNAASAELTCWLPAWSHLATAFPKRSSSILYLAYNRSKSMFWQQNHASSYIYWNTERILFILAVPLRCWCNCHLTPTEVEHQLSCSWQTTGEALSLIEKEVLIEDMEFLLRALQDSEVNMQICMGFAEQLLPL